MSDKMTTADGATVTYIDHALNVKTLLVTAEARRKSVAINLTDDDRARLVVLLGGRP